MRFGAFAGLAVMTGLAGTPCLATPNPDLPFVAGGARVDITPTAEQARQAGLEIHDPLSVRAIYLANGQTCAVLVAVDQSNLENRITADAIPRAAKALGCPAGQFIVSASHTHSGNTGGLPATGDPRFAAVADAIVDAAQQAKAQARPARVGYGTTQVDLNVNRDLFDGAQWIQGADRHGISDKTLAVVEFLDARGALIGAYYDYAMHPIHFADSAEISADFPGRVSAYIERRLPGSVALFAQGAGGDQNPLRTEPSHQVADLYHGRTAALEDRLDQEDGWTREARRLDAGAPQGTPVPIARLHDMPAYRHAVNDVAALIDGEGAILGESAIDVMQTQTPLRAVGGMIASAQGQFTCPGRDKPDDGIEQGRLPAYRDGTPVTITVGMLRIADIYLAWVNGEVFADIGAHLKRDAPVNHLMMVTLANGRANVDYIYSDAASAHLTFEVLRSRLKPGCAETGLVDTALHLIDRLK